MGYSIPYDSGNYTEEENRILRIMIDAYDIELSHIYIEENNKFHVKVRRGCYPMLMDYLRTTNLKPFKVREGNGSPGGVYRGSGGYRIEKKVRDQLNESLKSKEKCELFKKIVRLLPETKKKRIQCFLKREKENCRRPMVIQDGCINFKNNTCKNISDIDIFFHDTHNSAGILFISSEYISQKSSGLVTFINTGVQNKNCFPIVDIKNNNIQSEKGSLILKTLGINEDGFCSVFNNYESGDALQNVYIANKNNMKINFNNNIHDKTFELNLKKLIQKSMGEGNSIISHYIDHKNKIYRTKDKKIELLSYSSYYGGKSKKGKRIDVEIKTKDMIYTFNIRNKQGGVYPSHLMCDFKYHNGQMLP